MQEIIRMSVGENIRQMRRQQSLTQSELGDEHFSKSYVSAVERNKISPSYEALRFFAGQLGQPIDYFEKQFLQNEIAKYTTPVSTDSQVYINNEQAVQEKVLPLLDNLLEGAELYTLPFLHDFLSLNPDVIADFANDVQGRYAFLIGLIAQQKQNFAVALQSLERALPLAPYRYRPAILDALGTNYYYEQAYYTALDYHKRALHDVQELQEETENDPAKKTSALLLRIEFNCGNDYYAVGAHRQAREHFERARKLLRSTHDIKTAAQLYLKLGYCIYADVYHNTAIAPTTKDAIEEIEREFQRAVSYYVQSRTLYQVSSDRLGEAEARLSQAMVLLDLSTRRRQVAEEKARVTGKMSTINCATLLDEAEEQCRQILLAWESDTVCPTTEVEVLLYTALAYLIRVTVQRATIARLAAYTETATREYSIAAHLCQQVLDTFVEQAFPWKLVHNVAVTKYRTFSAQVPSLPHIPEAALHAETPLWHDASRSVVLFAAGEVAEMVGHTAIEGAYAEACYERAEQSFQAALSTYGQVFLTKERDISYLYRTYLRCIEMLEERKLLRPETEEKTNQALLHFLKDALQISYVSTL